jgi:(p)ppGpp synthase/HD superfamily hydrolase
MYPSSRLDRAFGYARELHHLQRRKGTEIPYLSHLMAVCAIVLEHSGTEDEAIAALLHDAIEDQGAEGTTRVEIECRFGSAVAEIVKGCTDADTVSKPPWHDRKRAYVAHIADASDSVRLVSAADKLHNARALLCDFREVGDALWGRFNAGPEDILWYYRALASAFKKARSTPLTRELNRTVTELERLVSLPADA